MKKLFFFAAVAATLVACSSSDPAQEAPKNDTIRLTTSVSGQTRSVSQTLQSTQIAANQSVWVKLTTDETAADCDNWSSADTKEQAFTADGAGVLNTTNAVKWPKSTATNTETKTVSAVAWAPATTAALTSFTVKADQTADADYLASDYLYGTSTAAVTFAQVQSGTAINIKFAHKLAKVNVTVSAATDANGDPVDPTGAKVVFGPATMNLSCNIDNTNIGKATATATTQGAITMNSSLTSAKTSSAIVVPQTLSGELLTFTLGTAVYKFSLPAAKTFEAGKVYTYTVSLRGNGSVLILNETITDWDAETPETVTATKQP